jgi:hypothetical protein
MVMKTTTTNTAQHHSRHAVSPVRAGGEWLKTAYRLVTINVLPNIGPPPRGRRRHLCSQMKALLGSEQRR